MKLLSPPEGKSQLAVQNAAQEVRSIELDKLMVAKRKELNDLDNRLVNSLSEVAKQGVAEEQLWKTRIAALTQEVDALESRRKSALVPLVSRENEVDDRERVLLKREEVIAMRESENDSERQMLEDRLDEVSEREAEANQYAISLNNREFAIGLQESQLKDRMDSLTTILMESLEEVKRAQTESARYKAMLKGRDVSIAEREKYVEAQEASFANREASILDKYRTLQKAITETNLNEPTGLHSAKRSKP